MRYENVKSFEQLAEAIQKQIEFEGRPHEIEGAFNMMPDGRTEVMDCELTPIVHNMTQARLAFARLKREGNRDDLTTVIPTDAIDLLSLCNDAASNKTKPRRKPEGDGTDLPNEAKPKSQAKTLDIAEVHKKANRSYKWTCKQRPGLIPETPARFTLAMYDYMKENCPEYREDSPPEYETWKRYLRHYEQVLHGLKDNPHLASEQPLSGTKPNEIQDISEITNRFQKD